MAVLALLLLIAVEFCLVLGAARFGAFFLARPLGKDIAVLLICSAQPAAQEGPGGHIVLQPEEAPGLFCDLATALPPRRRGLARTRVLLMMNVNAWVRLKGYRRGSGRTILAVGYDLLAGFPPPKSKPCWRTK